MDRQLHIADLIYKANKQSLTADEQHELDKWLAQNDDNKQLYNQLTDANEQFQHLKLYRQFDLHQSWTKVSADIVPERKLSGFSSRLVRYAAAILLPSLLGLSLYFYFSNQNRDPLAGIDEVIKPGSPVATLTLADGSKVELDQKQPIADIQQGKAAVAKQGSTLTYHSVDTKASTSENTSLIYNELSTPPGGTYTIKLSDGTRVVLNADSRLKYPVSFSDSIRSVSLSGEGYFEVTHSGSPFIVISEGQQVRVLGTIFNVNAYTESSEVKTTLVEGKVRIETSGAVKTLLPGDQSNFNTEAMSLTVSQVNTSAFTSWIDGKFEFTNDNLEKVIKQLARWYDFTYEFENEAAEAYHFTGRINNDQPISSVLKMLELSSGVQFELKENTLIIK